MMDETAWSEIGAPMMLDNNGNATFIYTPPSLHSRGASKARDPQHAAKLWKKAQADTTGRWAAFHFTSHDNPYISVEALSEITKDMSAFAIRQEIDAEDIDEAPGALWHRNKVTVGTQVVLGLEENRVFTMPELVRIVTGVDPSGSSSGDACGIVTAGIDDRYHHYTVDDSSVQGSPDIWARAACAAYHRNHSDLMVAEKNYGGEMVEKVIRDTDPTVNIKLVTATHGKAIRAEPVSALTERGEDHLVGTFPALEDELCQWVQGDKSPNRLDAKVWADTELSGSRPVSTAELDRLKSGEVIIPDDMLEWARQSGIDPKMLGQK
jgi:phage terminase large subunit-like protein